MATKKASKKRPAPARRRAARPIPSNDNLSRAINEYVPEALSGTDRFLDIVNWNIRYFNELDSARVRRIAQILAELNGDIFVLQEIADGALEDVARRLNESGAGFYKTAYGSTGGDQRVAFMWDTEWIRAKEDFVNLFGGDDEIKVVPGTKKRIFPRLPFQNHFLGRSSDGNIDFNLVGVHLKAFMGPEDDGAEQRRLAAERLTRWVCDEEEERDILIVGDWNRAPNAKEWKSLTTLEKQGKIRFHAWNNKNEGSHWYRGHTSRIDLVMVSAEIEEVAVEKEAKVIPWKRVFESPTLRNELIRDISDHMPVVSRFYFRDDDDA